MIEYRTMNQEVLGSKYLCRLMGCVLEQGIFTTHEALVLFDMTKNCYHSICNKCIDKL